MMGIGCLFPWSAWHTDGLAIGTEVFEVRRPSPAGEVYVVGARARLTNISIEERKILFYAALRPLGPAGSDVKDLAVSDEGDALLVDGHPALVPNDKPTDAGVLPTDTIGDFALAGKMPGNMTAKSPTGDCSGALRFDLTLAASQEKTVGFVCPVLPGRRAVGHRWDGKNPWAQLDEAKPNPPEGGTPQPDPGLRYYRELNAEELFKEAASYWTGFLGRARVSGPDPRWDECFSTIMSHVALSMNEGAPDVSVVNYNVFNRDGVYVANILQKSGHFDLAEQAIDYFLTHPFNGRIYPEADNPGQILWVMGEHWQFTRNKKWLERVYPSAQKLVAMVKYYRITPGPHWVCSTSLDFGEALPADKRQELKPGSCDGHHPEYTEAFDIAGLRGAVALAQAMGNEADAKEWQELADSLFEAYDKRFGTNLRQDYGSYSVLWPCRLYPFGSGKAHGQFKDIGAQKPTGWRYFPLATAHQGLLAGNREAGYATLAAHLDHEQMRGWYAFDEGGKSGAGGWRYARTTWDGSVAMPHGWAIAEVWLLLRDCLLFEDGNRLVLLAGIPPHWFTHPEVFHKGILVENLPTHFGLCSFAYSPTFPNCTLYLSGSASPPDGFVLRLPMSIQASVTADGKTITRSDNGDFLLPPKTKRVNIRYRK